MKFKYQAKTREGELQVGLVDAASRDDAASILGNHNLFILSIESAEQSGFLDRISNYFGRVKRKDMTIFTRQLATLLEARLPLSSALKTLQEQTSHPILKITVQEMSDDISAGLSMSQAMERHSDVFSGFFISMVRSAEVVGNMEEVIGFLADYMEKDQQLVSKTRSALIYPFVVIGLFIGVATVMITVVFPQLGPIFTQAGVKLPFFTRLLIGTGNFLAHWWFLVVIAVVVLIVMTLDYLQTVEGRAFLDDMKVEMPLVKKVFLPLMMTRLSNVLAMLLKGGVPVTQAVEITAGTMNNVLYKDILEAVGEDVRQGKPLSQALAKYPMYVPSLVPQMLVVGEATGQVDKMLMRLASLYGREADTVISNIVDLIQPILMIGIGALVGLLFASVLLPIYQLTTTIGQ